MINDKRGIVACSTIVKQATVPFQLKIPGKMFFPQEFVTECRPQKCSLC